jgi:hypothetical protein
MFRPYFFTLDLSVVVMPWGEPVRLEVLNRIHPSLVAYTVSQDLQIGVRTHSIVLIEYSNCIHQRDSYRPR